MSSLLLTRGSVLRGLRHSLAMLAATLSLHAAAATPAEERSAKADAVCTRCHDQGEARPVLSIYQTRHGVKADARTPGCQTCHGPSVAHVKNANEDDIRPPVDRAYNGRAHGAAAAGETASCLGCHKNGQRSHWSGSAHDNAAVPCASCHSVHVRQDRVMARGSQQEVCYACHQSERAQAHRVSSHPLATLGGADKGGGKMACSDCHNPHGSSGPTLMRKGSVNETCWSCHADKRGPFLWEHEPVTEACTTCHTPHGSNNAPLLKLRLPYLCQSCHSGDHAAQINSGANLVGGAVSTAGSVLPLASAPSRAQLQGRACQACHMQTHGSNHPAGAKLTR